MKTTDFAKHLTNFLGKYLPNERGYSLNTIATYTVSFKLLLEYMFRVHKIKADRIALSDLKKDVIRGFIDWLQKDRKCSTSTLNLRLTALRSFFKYLQYEDVKNIGHLQELLSVKQKKGDHPEVAWLTTDEMEIILKLPDTSTSKGLRDAVLLSTLYDSAARVQELIEMRPCDFRFENNKAKVRLFGKGSKERRVPLEGPSVTNLKIYMEKEGLSEPSRQTCPLFPNPQGGKLSRMAVLNIVKKYVRKAKEKKTGWFQGEIGCHTFRHSKAMHMLEAGVNLMVIRDFLGHESVVTTEVYARASDKMKREALAKVNPGKIKSQQAKGKIDKGLLKFLNDLAKRCEG